MRGKRWLAAGLGVVLAATPAPAVQATELVLPAKPQEEKAVPVSAVPVVPLSPDAAAAAAIRSSPAVLWPVAREVDVRLDATPARAGTLPVWVSGAGGGSVKVSFKDMKLGLERTGGGEEPVSVTVDYGRFRHAYGGDWASRLRLVRLPGNETVPARNDVKAGRLTADVSGGEFALAAGPSGATGNYAATQLALSDSWQVSGQTGDFGWTYPLRMPPTPGGLQPQLSIAYSSGSVDGRTASTNNQPSWLGEGFDLWSGYIERSYKGCGDDGPVKTGDQCWFSDNATLSLAGHSGPLVFEAAAGIYRLKDDDGSRIERLTGASNGDDDGEHWKLTTREGVQYFFGLKPETSSTWTVPVFGNNAGEPCYKGSFDASWCLQGYRWNLDYVVDARDNTMTYFYAKERNSYGLNLGKQTVGYDRGGVLQRAEFGTRKGNEANAPASVVFSTQERCVPGANCAAHIPSSYPDVPFDQECLANCTTLVSPTFWSTKRLASITTRIGTGTGTVPVETWTLAHSFPSPGDGTNASLWLSSITHSAGSLSLPPVTFGGLAFHNRVNSTGDGLPPLGKFRVVAVNNEYGGTLGINYAATDCSAAALPAPETNTKRCFPVYWQPDGGQPFTDWMHKYVVESLVQVDRVGGAPTQTTSYEYLGGGAWRYTDNELINPERRTWSQWRGYERVVVRHGASKIEHRYFRGMHGDRLNAGGGTKSVSIMDSEGGSVFDDEQLHGREREKTTYNGTAVVGSTLSDYWQRGPTAVQGPLKAYLVDSGSVRDRTALDGGAWRRTRIDRQYDTTGLVTQIDDAGDVSVTGDEQCTRTWYTARALPSRAQTVGVACAAAPADPISDVQTTYDAVGNPVKVENLADWMAGQPVYATASRATFDAYGRPVERFDALDRKTVMGYTESGGLTVKTAVSNDLGHTTNTTIDPAFGSPVTAIDPNNRRTDMRYDALGRVTGVWLPGRNEPAGEGPNLRYRYLIRSDGPSVVTTETLRANNNYQVEHGLYDGFLRPRQTQSPAWGGGRALTDSHYDERGLLAKVNDKYYAEGDPATQLVAAGDNNVPSQTVSEFDGVGRTVATIFRSLGDEKWRGTKSYHGDRIDTVPPPGGVRTSIVVDREGKTTERHEFNGAVAGVTRYTYTKAGQLATITDPGSKVWRYDYDLRGWRVAVDDPDKGHSTAIFDAAGQLLSTTDARGQTLNHAYDRLGRRTEERDAAGGLRARWTYDTLAIGMPTSSTRVEGGNAYTTAVTGYDTAYRPTGTKVTIPNVEAGLAGTYQTELTYRPDGSTASMKLPRAGDLAEETITFGYDELGLARTMTGASSYVNDTWYTRFAELAQVSMGAAGSKVWETVYYDTDTRRLARSLLQRETTTSPTVNDQRYTYDPIGNVTRIWDVTEVQCFAYDGLRRMTASWTVTDTCASPGGPGLTSYTYDPTGNRLTENQRTYTYAGHKLSSVSNGSTSDTYEYDATGNLVRRNNQSFQWDASGRLAGDGNGTSIVYDADGNRLIRREPGATTLYLGGQEIRLDRTTGVKTGTRFYTHGGKLIAARTGGGLFWQSGDHHGTSMTSIRSNTLEIARRRFTPFGAPRGAAVAWPHDKGFVGGTSDSSLGLVQLGAREYEPATGRFISVDPIIDPADPQQLNGYTYAGNNPASMSDPDGLKYFVDVDGLVTIPDKAHASPALIQRASQKAAKITRQNAEIKQRRDNAIRATGHTPEEYEELQKVRQKSVVDVVIEAGGEILKEVLGINDIKGCFSQGDLGSCISMVVGAVGIGFGILFKIGKLIKAVKKAWEAVTDFNKKRKKAEDLEDKVKDGSTQASTKRADDKEESLAEERHKTQDSAARGVASAEKGVGTRTEVGVPTKEPGMHGAHSGVATLDVVSSVALAVTMTATIVKSKIADKIRQWFKK